MTTLLDKLDTPNAPPTEVADLCPLCTGSESKFLFWNFDRLHHLPGKFGVVRCEGCKLVRLSPRPTRESIGLYYVADEYYSYQAPTNTVDQIAVRIGTAGKIRDWIRNSVLEYLGYPVLITGRWQKVFQPMFVAFFKRQATFGWDDRFPKYVPSGRALDIGCGNGLFLSHLRANGWHVNGIEINEAAAVVAREQLGVEVFVGELQDAPFERETFDFINVSHVLEHVHDPHAFLLRAKELLKRDGTIYLEVPNVESVSQKLSGKYWFPWETPRHLFLYSPNTLRKQIEKAGFSMIKMSTKLEDQYDVPARYELEEKLGKKLPVDYDLPLYLKLRTGLWRLLIKSVHLLNRNSGDFLFCRIANRPSGVGRN